MAAEAVILVKKAEDEGKEIMRRSAEQTKQIVGDARQQALDRRRDIIAQANHQRRALIDTASQEAEKDSEALENEGAAERARLLSPDPAKRESAVNLIFERIVSVNGDR